MSPHYTQMLSTIFITVYHELEFGTFIVYREYEIVFVGQWGRASGLSKKWLTD